MAEPVSTTQDVDPKEVEKQVTGLESRMDRIRALYEQYFQGIEKLEPLIERKAIKTFLLEMRGKNFRNTGLRFRVNQLIAKMATYENYWNRVTRQMEDGTYQRDIFKARLHAKLREEARRRKGQPAGTEPAPFLPEGADLALEAPALLRPMPAAPAPQAAGLSDDKVGAIYDAFILAKRRCKEPLEGITKDALASSLRKQIPQILKQYNCKSVEFKVVIKNGKTILKAVPKV
jgi:hypothetical protein